MVSIHCALASVVAAASLAVSNALQVGEYFRPLELISGNPNNTDAAYRRSPCPGINLLANHGYIARDGKNITKADMRAALLDVFNLEPLIFDSFPVPIPDTFDLNLFGRHNYFEHDVSFSRADFYIGQDAGIVDPALIQDVARRGSATAPLTASILGQVLKEREAKCVAENPDCRYSAAARAGATSGAASILSIFGDATTETISVSRFESMVGLEKFPEDWKRPTVTMTQARINTVAAKVNAASLA